MLPTPIYIMNGPSYERTSYYITVNTATVIVVYKKWCTVETGHSAAYYWYILYSSRTYLIKQQSSNDTTTMHTATSVQKLCYVCMLCPSCALHSMAHVPAYRCVSGMYDSTDIWYATSTYNTRYKY